MSGLVGNVELASAAALLLLVVLAAVARAPFAGTATYAWASLPQAAIAVALAATAGGWSWLWLEAAFILAIKGVAVPALLRRTFRQQEDGHAYGLSLSVSPPLLLGGVAAVVLLGLRIGVLLDIPAGRALGLCLATMLLGFGVPAVRSELWAQTVGILLGEGAVMAAGFVLAGDVPVAAEALAIVDVWVLAAVLVAVLRRVVTLHGAADAFRLRVLRG